GLAGGGDLTVDGAYRGQEAAALSGLGGGGPAGGGAGLAGGGLAAGAGGGAGTGLAGRGRGDGAAEADRALGEQESRPLPLEHPVARGGALGGVREQRGGQVVPGDLRDDRVDPAVVGRGQQRDPAAVGRARDADP